MSKFAVKILTKKQTQSIIKDLRNAGYDIEKTSFGYISASDIYVDGKTKPLFKALNGHNSYIIHYYEELFSPAI